MISPLGGKEIADDDIQSDSGLRYATPAPFRYRCCDGHLCCTFAGVGGRTGRFTGGPRAKRPETKRSAPSLTRRPTPKLDDLRQRVKAQEPANVTAESRRRVDYVDKPLKSETGRFSAGADITPWCLRRLLQGAAVDRWPAHALADRREDRIGYGGNDAGRASLAHPAGRLRALHDVDFDGRRFVHA